MLIPSRIFLFFCFWCFLSWSCTKIDDTSIGADLLPAVDNVNTFDTTINVIANNFDSASTDCYTYYPEDQHILGNITANPLFGTTQATIYTELKPGSYPFNFPANTTLDSIVLVLSYRGSFGDTVVPQKVVVHQIAGVFKPDSTSCKSYNHDGLILGSAVYSPQQLNDSVKGFRELSSHQLRIKLDNELGQMLLGHDPSAVIATDSAFKEIFKGFALVPDVSFGGNALSYFSLADTNTKLSVYYRSTTNSITDTSVTNFRLTYLCGSANYVIRNHTGFEIANHKAHPPLGDEEIYIQSTPGTYAEIKIAGLDKLSNRIIHRGVLTMDQIYDDNSFFRIFATPNILSLDLRDTSFDKDYKPIPCDFSTLSGVPDIDAFGGFRTIVKDPAGHEISRYTFNISRYLQKIVTNKIPTSTFRLRAPDNILNSVGYIDECGQSVVPFLYPLNPPAFGQVRLGGGNNLNYRMKLYIVYSGI